jgi:cytochrome c-type biogenesis protein CcmH/NrfG
MVRQQSTTLYDILGVSQEASIQEIRSAFRRLTMQHHPDRFRGKDREQAEQHFQSITEAFNVLSRPESRDKYDREISQGQTDAMDPKEISRRLAAKGAQELKTGRLAEAIANLESAVDHDNDNARAHYFLGVALSNSSVRQRDALRHLERAIQLEPNNPTMKAEAAAVALANGMKNRAQRLAQEALTLDPTSTKANEVLARIEAPQEPQAEGLLGRLRRKG